MSLPSRVFRRAPGVLSRRVGEEVFLAGVDRAVFDQLSGTACVVWQLLESPRSVQELAQELCDRYRASLEVVSRDVETLLSEMSRRALVDESPHEHG